jgi:tetratricopeptide (TPR) repeat protein
MRGRRAPMTLVWLAISALAGQAAPGPVIAQTAAAPTPSWVPPPAGSGDPAGVDPAGAKADHAAGLAKLQAGQVGEAVELFKSAAGKDPGSAAIANDLGFALSKLGARREAEEMYRRALAIEPRRQLAYANLAELVAQSPERWQRREEIMALLEKGQLALRDDVQGRQLLTLACASFEQSVGRGAEARTRLEALLREDLPAVVRRRAQDKLDAIAQDERALSLADWPAAPLPAAARAQLQAAEAQLQAGHADEALTAAVAIVEAHPDNVDARFVRARALDALGRPDEANRELTLLLQLQPSHAGAWRLLGTLLAAHGGLLATERADEALRRALALEPSWDDLRELRRRLGERRADVGQAPRPRERKQPTARAQALYDDAQRWLATETPELARAPLTEALGEFPAYVDAAAALFTLSNEVPPATVAALHDDGEALTRLATELLRIRPEAATAELVRPWLDRAVALKNAGALYARALLRADGGDVEGALADLTAYVASDVNPQHLGEARALRRTLEPTAPGRRTSLALARQLLLSDQTASAARALGGSCRPGLDGESLVELGRIAEYDKRTAEALGCHRLALVAADGANDAASERARIVDSALARIARIASHGSAAETRSVLPELQRAHGAHVPAAAWALARQAQEEGRWEAALALGGEFVAAATPGDPLRAEATGVLAQWQRLRDDRDRARKLRFGAAGIGGGALVLLAALVLVGRRWRGHTVAAALGARPDLFPEVAAAVAEIRHDVLKHRASALGMLGLSVTSREVIARALREPAPASTTVVTIYDRLRRAAAAVGITLRAIDAEPLFSPIVRALARAEATIDRAGNGAELAEIDRALREQHGPALATLLALCPRTRLDPAQIAGWLRAVTVARDSGRDADALGGAIEPAEPGENAGNARPSTLASLTVPGLHLPALDLEVPLPREALHVILANLVRNALGAVQGAADAKVLVRVEEQRDATGRRLVTVVVADSAAATVSLEQIEQRNGQRGLGIVRDLVRRWGGHLIVRGESAPFVKAIGAAFPVTSIGLGSQES